MLDAGADRRDDERRAQAASNALAVGTLFAKDPKQAMIEFLNGTNTATGERTTTPQRPTGGFVSEKWW